MTSLVRKPVLFAAFCVMAAALWAKDSVSDLIAQLKTTQGEDRLPIIRALGESHDAKAVEPLLGIFDVPQSSMVDSRYIVIALGELKDARAVPNLTDAWIYLTAGRGAKLGTNDLPVEVVVRYQLLRESIIHAFGQIGGDDAVRILVSATRDGDGRIVGRACAELAQRRYKDTKSLPCSASDQ
jgi:HEAT repeat protein